MAGVTYKRVSYDLFVIGLLTLITFVPIVHYTNFRSTFLAQGYSPIVQRAVKVHLNVLVPKWDDDARSQLNCDECALDIAGGFSWQNRILFPAIKTSDIKTIKLPPSSKRVTEGSLLPFFHSCKRIV